MKVAAFCVKVIGDFKRTHKEQHMAPGSNLIYSEISLIDSAELRSKKVHFNSPLHPSDFEGTGKGSCLRATYHEYNVEGLKIFVLIWPPTQSVQALI